MNRGSSEMHANACIQSHFWIVTKGERCKEDLIRIWFQNFWPATQHTHTYTHNYFALYIVYREWGRIPFLVEAIARIWHRGPASLSVFVIATSFPSSCTNVLGQRIIFQARPSFDNCSPVQFLLVARFLIPFCRSFSPRRSLPVAIFLVASFRRFYRPF